MVRLHAGLGFACPSIEVFPEVGSGEAAVGDGGACDIVGGPDGVSRGIGRVREPVRRPGGIEQGVRGAEAGDCGGSSSGDEEGDFSCGFRDIRIVS